MNFTWLTLMVESVIYWTVRLNIASLKFASGDMDSGVNRLYPHVCRAIFIENAPEEDFIVIG
ncbi:hypothetical protein VK70_11285 [Paenibacillus durus ATCC 35681]|uniref:Uncharacterized protein n=1 Tax=Paenibacillus durus ATCC 35681 TaxID=1333534 RepID=A0A0F7CIY4_PAEDU|nr:hypothetical protein VK70_11285 [Paenibacillus durus ATCC 35681]